MGVVVRFHHRNAKDKGAWTVFVTHNGRRRSKRCKSRGQAEKLGRAIRLQLERKDFALPEKKAATPLETYATEWLDSATTLKPSTVRYYRQRLAHIAPVLGKLDVSSITRADVKHLVASCTAKKMATSQVRGTVAVLSTILSEAVEDGLLPANPALRPGRLRRAMRDAVQPKKEIDPYTRDEAEALLETARTKFAEWYPFLLTALRTGMRLGELRALRWGDLDWRGSFAMVTRNYVLGKFGSPKSGKGRRVDLSRQLRAELYLWRRKQRAKWLKKGKPMPALVFAGPDGKPLDDSFVRRAVRRIVKAADLRVRGSVIHVMRHTYAAQLLQAGTPITYVRDQLGHQSIAVTVDVYGAQIPGGHKGEVDKLDATSAEPMRRKA